MTGENKRRNIAQELARAEAALRAGQACQQSGCYSDAVSRAYYAAFYHARALLLLEGLEAKTHGGVVHLVSQHFVKSARLEARIARYLDELQADRGLADYDAATVFTDGDVLDLLEKAREYADAVRAIIRQAGYI